MESPTLDARRGRRIRFQIFSDTTNRIFCMLGQTFSGNTPTSSSHLFLLVYTISPDDQNTLGKSLVQAKTLATKAEPFCWLIDWLAGC